MPSETDALNDALSMIGANTITAIDDGSREAEHCRRIYPTLRDALLRMDHWRFAGARATLAQGPNPPFEYAFSYPLPDDFIKMREYNGAMMAPDQDTLLIFGGQPIFKWDREGNSILTNDGEVKIEYTRRVTNPAEWDSLFYQVLTSWLGSKLALALPRDAKMSQLLLQQAMGVYLPLATATGGQEGSVQPYIVDDLIWGR